MITLTAINCTLPVIKAKVDVRPGTRVNTVYPNNGNKLVSVRIFGSKRIQVKKIVNAHLGEAPPAAVPKSLKKSLRPKDVNKDGRLDRLFYFRMNQTDIRCHDKTTRVTGRTSDKKRFQSNASIVTADCD